MKRILSKPVEIRFKKKGMREGHDYYIARKGEACLTSGMGELCLQENENFSWNLYIEERGNKNVIAVCPGPLNAIRFFYYYLIGGTGPFEYREEWERDTGLEF